MDTEVSDLPAAHGTSARFRTVRSVASAALACVLIAAGTTLANAAPETALPWCAGVGAPVTLAQAPATFEAIAFDRNGRLVVSDWVGGGIDVMDAPGAPLRGIAGPIPLPGGLAPEPGGTMLVGVGVTPASPLAPGGGVAELRRLDLDTGATTTVATGLSQGNGVVRAKDGTVFVTNDGSDALDRVDPDGRVTAGWYRGSNTNGGAISADGTTLYVNVTFGDTHVLAIDIATGNATTFFRPPAALSGVALDDIKIDERSGYLFVTAWQGGQVWRIAPDGSSGCVLLDGRLLPAGIAVGKEGAGFAPTSVYVGTHSGSLIEIPGAVPAS
ncbi:SMP-30/gluconolactonase/LRE family protein [Nocardia bovistercoris]|uniref:SMP-30/gluconolactonase/LRE family protein n=1 Tax=Nocardia bovistercoris TaxID=2785916 RepID=A0A931MYN5_9NOCA|nr:SMP-30/gluconolactonase/LRE family protein [Nocardia bovistercoris]MBH0775220.1 SMP-30/gluconolactonase/LRE family protein [Nocardia bovistercoris]